MSKYGVFSGPYFRVFGLNTEVYSVNLRIQSEYRKLRTRHNFVLGHLEKKCRLITDINPHQIPSIRAFNQKKRDLKKVRSTNTCDLLFSSFGCKLQKQPPEVFYVKGCY